MDNSNYDHFHCGGDFLHAYVIMHKYFGKKKKKNFYMQLNMFAWKFPTNLPILGAINSKPSEYKKSTKWKK